jgi:threonine synthase
VEYVSTRGRAAPVDFRGALLGGLATDGGLYIPSVIPTLPEAWRAWSYPEAVAASLRLFGADDTIDLAAEAAARFDHREVAPIVEVGDRLVFELFWGPTLSFKDHALQVLARLLARETSGGVVLGATSGDTGAAAIEACRKLMRIVMLYPEGRVSELQRRQMTTVTDPDVVVVAVRGTFDDCQRMVKEAFASTPGLLAVNSINWARVAAQVGYYLHAAGRIEEPFDVVVPTGNFGNAYSCWVAKKMGAPIESIILANNANHNLADLVRTGSKGEGRVLATLAPAMDIQVPSNLERLQMDPTREFTAGWADDTDIVETIRDVRRKHGYLLDPHTATAWHVGSAHQSHRPQLVVATAHPAKFPDVIERATGETPTHPRLEALSSGPEHHVSIEAEASALVPYLR